MFSLGKTIADLRREKGHNQKFLAISSGIDKTTYSRIENGTRGVCDEELKAIASVLDLSTDHIIFEWQQRYLTR